MNVLWTRPDIGGKKMRDQCKTWRSSVHGRVITKAAAAIMAGLLAFPGTAFAATQVGVGENVYYEAANGAGSNGGSWSWDGANGMVLDNYNGSSITAVGDLNVNLEGENHIVTTSTEYFDTDAQGISTYSDTSGSADLTITGDGSLSVTANPGVDTPDPMNTYAWGVYSDESVTVDGTTVNVDFSNSGIGSTTGIVADDVTIKDGSNVTVNTTDATYNRDFSSYNGWGGISAWGSGVAISDSTVDVKATVGYGIYGVGNSDTNGNVGVRISNSDVSAIGTGHGIFSEANMVLDNSDIRAKATAALGEGVIEPLATGASEGAGIAAMGTISLSNVTGVSVAVDENGVSYVVGPNGETGDIAMKHVGEASKFVNGVGNTKSKSPEASGSGRATPSTSQGSKRLADTGNGIADLAKNAADSFVDNLAKAATAITRDRTSYSVFFAVLAGGLFLAFSGFIRKRRSSM
jgi:hypothetical protein